MHLEQMLWLFIVFCWWWEVWPANTAVPFDSREPSHTQVENGGMFLIPWLKQQVCLKLSGPCPPPRIPSSWGQFQLDAFGADVVTLHRLLLVVRSLACKYCSAFWQPGAFTHAGGKWRDIYIYTLYIYIHYIYIHYIYIYIYNHCYGIQSHCHCHLQQCLPR